MAATNPDTSSNSGKQTPTQITWQQTTNTPSHPFYGDSRDADTSTRIQKGQ